MFERTPYDTVGVILIALGLLTVAIFHPYVVESTAIISAAIGSMLTSVAWLCVVELGMRQTGRSYE